MNWESIIMPEKLSLYLREQAVFYVLNTLSHKEEDSIKGAMADSAELRSYVEEVRKTVDAADLIPGKEPSKSFLEAQRLLLRGQIDEGLE
jgi:hypothetical protein